MQRELTKPASQTRMLHFNMYAAYTCGASRADIGSHGRTQRQSTVSTGAHPILSRRGEHGADNSSGTCAHAQASNMPSEKMRTRAAHDDP